MSALKAIGPVVSARVMPLLSLSKPSLKLPPVAPVTLTTCTVLRRVSPAPVAVAVICGRSMCASVPPKVIANRVPSAATLEVTDALPLPMLCRAASAAATSPASEPYGSIAVVLLNGDTGVVPAVAPLSVSVGATEVNIRFSWPAVAPR